jgi:ribosomal protein L37AE/L43A
MTRKAKRPKCPVCDTLTTYYRSYKTPHWKCFRCGHTFNVKNELPIVDKAVGE